MSTKLHQDQAAEREATDIGARFMHSSDVVGDMSRAYGRDLSSVRIHTDESAARGAAERGGLREWFNRLFSKSGNGEEPASEQEPAAEIVTPEPEPVAPAQDAAETDNQSELTQNNDPRKELDDAAEALRTSKKWGLLGNSDKFENVSAAIHASVGKLNATLSGDLAQDQDILGEITASFRELINACDDYIASHDPSTNRGKHRQDIVRQVRELAAKDLAGFAIYMSSPDKGEHFTNAIDILKKSRQRTLQLVDKKEDELQHVGGAASYIAKIEPGMLTDTDASGFFKEDETFTNFATSEDMRLSALESVRRKKGLTDQQFEEMKEIALSDGKFEERLPDFYKNRALFEGVALYRRLISAQNTIDTNLPNPMREGETLNLSKRNVATSRLAELLGLGDLVAKSETATLVDADGKSRSGNLMQAAQGQEVTSFILEQYQAQYSEKMESAENVSTVELTTGIEDKVTPEFLKSLMSLQVLDNLAAQADRHSGNYFAQVKDGKLGKVQAIDNDFSFSNITLDWEPGTSVGSIGSHGFIIFWIKTVICGFPIWTALWPTGSPRWTKMSSGM